MNKTTADTSHADDWLTPLLLQDAHGDRSPQQDAAFVAQVLTRLDAPLAAHVKPCIPKVHTALNQERGLLLGFQMLVVVFIFLSAPAGVQAWLQVAQAPMNMLAWYDHNLWSLALGLGMMVYGALKLLNMPEEAMVLEIDSTKFLI